VLRRTCVALSILLILPGNVGTARGDAEGDPFQGFAVASHEKLTEMRGGFVGMAGGQSIELSFGIEQAVLINDQLVIATRLTVPSINRAAEAHVERFISGVLATPAPAQPIAAASPPVGSPQAIGVAATGTPVAPVQVTTTRVDQVSVSTLQSQIGQLSLVQIGPGNTFSLNTAELPSGVLNIIQNTLDNQTIRQTTALQMSVNSVSLVRGMNFGEMIQRQLTGSLR